MLMIDGWSISCEIAQRLMSLDLTDEKSTLAHVMAYYRQETSRHLSQWWFDLICCHFTWPEHIELMCFLVQHKGTLLVHNLANSVNTPFTGLLLMVVPHKHGLTLIMAWMNGYIHYKMWDEITRPFNNFITYEGATYIRCLTVVQGNLVSIAIEIAAPSHHPHQWLPVITYLSAAARHRTGDLPVFTSWSTKFSRSSNIVSSKISGQEHFFSVICWLTNSSFWDVSTWLIDHHTLFIIRASRL